MNRDHIIESAKNAIIVVLFITAILLLSFFWQGVSLDDLSVLTAPAEETDTYMPELGSLVVPDRITVCFGSDMYTMVQENYSISEEIFNSLEGDGAETYSTAEGSIYAAAMGAVAQYMQKPDIRVEKIEEAQYDEVMSYPSMVVEFDYAIPVDEFFENNNLTKVTGLESMANVSAIALSSASSENLFLYDSSADEYYRFVTDDEALEEKMSAAINSLADELEAGGLPVYYTISNLVGADNDTLIPVYVESDMKTIRYENEFEGRNQQNLTAKIETSFFPTGLDFVRKITENKGTVLYMYRYSEKVLKIDESGCITYTEELDPAKYADTTFYGALQTAVEYTAKHGGWSKLNSDSFRPYLKSAEKITGSDSKSSGYRFVIGLIGPDAPIEYDKGEILSIDVFGSQVTSYVRDIVLPAADASEDQGGERWTAINAIDVITTSYNDMCQILGKLYSEAGKEAVAASYSADDRFETLTRHIDTIELCYMRDSATSQSSLVPVWLIEADGCTFWFNAVDGSLLGHNAEVSS